MELDEENQLSFDFDNKYIQFKYLIVLFLHELYRLEYLHNNNIK